MFYVRTYFIQYRSSPEPLLSFEMSSRFIAQLWVHLGELVLSGVVTRMSHFGLS